MSGDNNQLIAAQEFLQASTSFDEVLPEPIKITWAEYVEYQETLEDGRVITKRRLVKRVSEINTYVPVKILNRMMSSQEKIKRMQTLRAKGQDQIDGQTQQEMIDWMAAQVLNVWQLTEPDMTLEKLQEAFDFQKMFGLFNLFFGNLLAGLNKR
jgi:hypothetical protein